MAQAVLMVMGAFKCCRLTKSKGIESQLGCKLRCCNEQVPASGQASNLAAYAKVPMHEGKLVECELLCNGVEQGRSAWKYTAVGG